MKRSMVAVGIGIWIVAAHVSFAQSPASQPSAIKLQAAEFNFGKAWAGATVTHTFRTALGSERFLSLVISFSNLRTVAFTLGDAGWTSFSQNAFTAAIVANGKTVFESASSPATID